MKTVTMKAKEVTAGMHLLDAEHKVVKVLKVSKGFWPSSVLFDLPNEDFSCVNADAEVFVVK